MKKMKDGRTGAERDREMEKTGINSKRGTGEGSKERIMKQPY